MIWRRVGVWRKRNKKNVSVTGDVDVFGGDGTLCAIRLVDVYKKNLLLTFVSTLFVRAFSFVCSV